VTKKRLYCTTTREKESEKEKHTQINKEKKREIFYFDHFESLLITRINAAFSSFRRVLSDLTESIFFKENILLNIKRRFLYLLLNLLLIRRFFFHKLVFPKLKKRSSLSLLLIIYSGFKTS